MESISFKDIIQPSIIAIGFIVGLYQYNRQQKFKRLQNLSALWKGFADSDDMLSLFNLMDELSPSDTRIEELKQYDRKTKLKYLALIEEVSLYVEKFEVDNDYAKYLFQWHFYFVYQSPVTSAPFWANMGEIKEMNASYWKKSRDFSAQCNPA